MDLALSLRPRLAAFAAEGVFVGTSSWKYEGWTGQIYTPDRYETRKEWSQAKFERECLKEYAETFSTVCVDAGYYQFPTEPYLAGLCGQVPDGFRFGFKVTDEVTLKKFPNLPRFGQRAGATNPHFLDAGLFYERFITPCLPFRSKIGPLIFEFSTFHRRDFEHGRDFVAARMIMLDAARRHPEVATFHFILAGYDCQVGGFGWSKGLAEDRLHDQPEIPGNGTRRRGPGNALASRQMGWEDSPRRTGLRWRCRCRRGVGVDSMSAARRGIRRRSGCRRSGLPRPAFVPIVGAPTIAPWRPVLPMNPMNIPLLAGQAARLFAAAFLLLQAPLVPARADLYERGDSGNFSDPKWTDTSTKPPEPESGPPGAGDTALIDGGSANTITASGGSVNLLQGTSNFSLSGAFSAKTLDYTGMLMGTGTLTAETVSGVSPALLTIDGGNLVATTMAEDFQVDGGSLQVTTFTGVNGTILDSGNVTLLNGQTNLNLGLSSGAQLTLPSLTDDIGQNINLDGANTLMTATGALEQNAGTLDISNGAKLKVGSDFNLDGASIGVGDVGGGGHWGGGGTVTVARTLTAGRTIGSIALLIDTGVEVDTNAMFIGQDAGSTGFVTLDGNGTILALGQSMGIGASGNGTLQMQNGASLGLKENASVAIGFDEGSVGTLTADGAMTVVDVQEAMTGVGVFHGSNGQLTLTNGATLMLGRYASIGEAGNGLIEASSGSQIQVINNGVARPGQTEDLVIGGQKAGKGDFGALSVQDTGSTFSSELPITVARDAGSSGGIGVTGSFALRHALIVGNSGAGTIDEAADGQMSISGSDTIAHFGENPKSSGIVSIQDPGTLLKFDQIAEVFFGNEGKGSLNITGGAAASYVSALDSAAVPSGRMAFGYLKGSEGDLTVDGAGSSFTTGAALIIGYTGKAVWRITDGGSAQTYLTELGAKKGSIATVTVDGAGSNWTNTDNLFVGLLNSQAPGVGGSAAITVSNGATLRSGPTLLMAPTATMTITGGQVSVARGVDSFGPAGSLRIGNGGKVLGKGKIFGQVIVGLGGKYNPGGDPGAFTVQGDFAEEAGAELDIELGGTGAGKTYDQLHVTGAASLNGTLNVTLVDGFNPSAQESFTIVTASSVTGTFSQVIGADVTYGANSITVKPKITPSTLTVSVNPASGGTVSPGFLGTSTRNIGFTYTVTATPAKGMSFAGWTGSLTSTSAKLTFAMQAGMTLQANFVATPFGPATTGAYAGLAQSASGAGDGFLSLALLANGTFTAKFAADGTIIPFKGQFTGDGVFQQSLVIGGHQLAVNLQLDLSGGGITGMIGLDSDSFTVTASRAAFNASTNPAPEAGAYTFYLPPNPADASGDYPPPQGNGWATASISAAGQVKLAGRLADNTAWSASGFLAKDGSFDLYASLYGGAGLLSGTLIFAAPPRDPSASVSDVTGSLTWSAPANNAKNAVFPSPFTTTLTPIGSFYTPPLKNTRILPGLDGTGDAQLQFTGGDLPSNFPVKAITITLQNAVHYSPASPADKLTMTFTASTGAFSGKFYNGSLLVPFTGVVLQKQQEGDGLFLGGSDSGDVKISP